MDVASLSNCALSCPVSESDESIRSYTPSVSSCSTLSRSAISMLIFTLVINFPHSGKKQKSLICLVLCFLVVQPKKDDIFFSRFSNQVNDPAALTISGSSEPPAHISWRPCLASKNSNCASKLSNYISRSLILNMLISPPELRFVDPQQQRCYDKNKRNTRWGSSGRGVPCESSAIWLGFYFLF